MIGGWLAGAARADDGLLDRYEAVRVALARDDIDHAKIAAVDLSIFAPEEVVRAARAVATASDGAAARVAFGELSRATVRAIASEPPMGVRVFRCPMTDAWPYWLQAGAGIANPYMGLAMPTCGTDTSLRAAVRAAAER